MTSDRDDFEPHHASSPTDHLLTELQLYGFRPFQDELDPRPLPDQMLDVLPIGVMHFPGTGIQDNLADKARKLGIPVWKFGGA